MIKKEHPFQSLSLEESKEKLSSILRDIGYEEKCKKYSKSNLFQCISSKDAYLLIYHIAFILAKESHSLKELRNKLQNNLCGDVLYSFGLTDMEYERDFEGYILLDYPSNWTGYYQNYSGSPYFADMQGVEPQRWAYLDYLCPVVSLIGGEVSQKPFRGDYIVLIIIMILTSFSFLITAMFNELLTKSIFIIAAIIFLPLITYYDTKSIPKWKAKWMSYSLFPITYLLSSFLVYFWFLVFFPYKLESVDCYVFLISGAIDIAGLFFLWLFRNNISAKNILNNNRFHTEDL